MNPGIDWGGATRRFVRSHPVTGWPASLARQPQEHPARTVALSLGLGFVLGGGLFSRLTGRLVGAGVRLGIRLLLLPMVVEGLVAMGEGAFQPVAEAGKTGGSSDSRSEPNQGD